MDRRMGRTTVFREQSQLTALLSDGASMVEEIGRSMTAALNQGNAVVCIATGTHRRLFEQQLKVRGIDVVGALVREQLVCINALDTLMRIMVNGEPDVIRFAEVVGAPLDRAANRYPRVQIFSELDLLPHSGVSGALELDRLLACLVESRSVFFRCPGLEDAVRQEPGRRLFVDGALALGAMP